MPLFRRNRPNHSLLLMPVRLGNERWPKNKVRILSCDVDGNLFTQLLGRSIYRRIKEETLQREVSRSSYATIYWDSGESKLVPLFVEIGKKEIWALEHILEHAVRRAVIPDLLKRYPKEIIKLGGDKYQQLLAGRTVEKRKTTSAVPSRALGRLPYYRKQDMEVSVPIYKAEYAFPLIVLKLLPQAENMPSGQQPLLVLDGDGDIVVTALPLEKVGKARRKLTGMEKKGKEGRIVCFNGASVDVMELSAIQSKALGTLVRRFEETGEGKQPLPVTVKRVLSTAREKL